MSSTTNEPLETVKRSIQEYGGGLYSNITKNGTAITGIQKGDDVAVDIHEDRIVIRRWDDD